MRSNIILILKLKNKVYDITFHFTLNKCFSFQIKLRRSCSVFSWEKQTEVEKAALFIQGEEQTEVNFFLHTRLFINRIFIKVMQFALPLPLNKPVFCVHYEHLDNYKYTY
jgi:hypothetical protein